MRVEEVVATVLALVPLDITCSMNEDLLAVIPAADEMAL